MAKKNKNPEIRFKGFTEDWEEDFIGSFYNFKNGLNKGKEYFGYGKPIVNFTDVFHKRGLLTIELKGKVDVNRDEIKNYSVQLGDIFFTRTSETIEEIGQPSVMLDSPKDAVFSGFVLRARPINEDPLELSFKQYAFYTDLFRSEMTKKSSMTTRALTSGTAIKKMIFSFPKSKIEQKKIGTFFQNLDGLITQQQKKHDKLVILKKAMLHKMFPKNGAVVPEIRFKGFNEDWEDELLGNISDITTGRLDANAMVNTGKYRFYTCAKDFYFIDNYAFNTEALLISGNGANVGYIHYYKGKFNAYQRTYVLDNFEKNVQYLKYFLELKLNKRISEEKKEGNTPYIVKSTLSEIELLIPKNSKEQQKIGDYFKNLDKQITLHQTQLSKLNNIKKACLSKMFVSQE